MKTHARPLAYGRGLILAAVLAAALSAPSPARQYAGGPIAGRALFDDNHNALPAIAAFDNDAPTPAQ
jgi:hypothetical protein